ncbi:hypothetical protein NU219Hw_g8568t1 [Hortaea werneckii]
MSTFTETIELTYEGIGRDMTVHRYPRHRPSPGREHVQSNHRRRQAIEQNRQSQLVHRQKRDLHTLMQHREATAGERLCITNLVTENDRAKEDPIRPGVQQHSIPLIQPTNNPREEEAPPPPLHMPHRQTAEPLPPGPSQPEPTHHLPIPPDLLELAQYINRLPRNPRRRRTTKRNINNDDNKPSTHQPPTSSSFTSSSSSSAGIDAFPSRNILKRDPKLKGAISRKTGCLLLEKSSGARLRKWCEDQRLFSVGLWRFLTEDGGT